MFHVWKGHSQSCSFLPSEDLGWIFSCVFIWPGIALLKLLYSEFPLHWTNSDQAWDHTSPVFLLIYDTISKLFFLILVIINFLWYHTACNPSHIWASSSSESERHMEKWRKGRRKHITHRGKNSLQQRCVRHFLFVILELGSCDSGVEPASCYRKGAGSIPLVCMSNCPWARYWTPISSWCAGRHLAATAISVSMYVWITGQKCLLNALKCKM